MRKILVLFVILAAFLVCDVFARGILEESVDKWEFTVTLDKPDGVYYEGELAFLEIYSERDSYFEVIHVDVNDNTQIIYPTNPRDSNFIGAGQTRIIPDNGRFVMGEPFGEEMIIVNAYDRPFVIQGFEVPSHSLETGIIDNAVRETSPSITARLKIITLPEER